MKTIINDKGQRVLEYGWEEFYALMEATKQCGAFDRTEDLNGKTLVVKHTWGIGDTFFLTAALHALKVKFPHVFLVAAVRYTDLLKDNPDVHEILDWRMVPGPLELAPNYKGQDWRFLDYDCVVKSGYDLRINSRSGPAFNDYLASLFEKDNLTYEEEIFLRQAPDSPNRECRIPVLDIYLNHAGVLGVEKPVIRYQPTKDELFRARAILGDTKKAVVLLPQTSTQFKDYPHWPEVIEKTADLNWYILGNRWPNCPKAKNVADLTDSFNIRDSIAVCLEAALLCSGDTGMLYPRAAEGKPCLVLHGPTEPFGFLTYFPSARGLRIKALKDTEGRRGMCSTGCFIDTLPCIAGSPPQPCLKELSPHWVLNEIRGILG